MNMFLTLAYLFFIGSTLGWVAELLYRRFLSGANPERKWINPGFCVGPYVPLYGSGLCILYLLASIGEKNGVDTVGEKLLLFAGMALSMTAIEYIAGIVSLKFMHIRLWDYSKQWGNIQGLICPAFSVLWAAVSAVYYFCVHPYILDALDWLSRNLAFSFVIGFFFGVFTIDLVYSAKLVSRIRKFADEHDVVIKVENLKAHIRQRQEERREKYSCPMYMTVLFASPRGAHSNTRALLVPFLETWRAAGHTAEVFSLFDLHIESCRACRGCQMDWEHPACVLADDMPAIFDAVLRSDILLLAAPIHSWFCPAPMKAALDRFVYALNKYYGPRGRGPSLLSGKSLAILTTCGYRPEKGADLFIEGMRRWCRHTDMRYMEALTERHLGYDHTFMDAEKETRARAFARSLMQA